jgi:hypothetical protein
MGFAAKLTALKLEDDAYAMLSFTEGIEVWHISDTYVEDALGETDTARMLAQLLSNRDYSVYTVWETNILQEMRIEGLLDDYDYDYTFTDFVTSVIRENNYDYGWLDTTTTQYDYKRGRCDVVARVLVRVGDIQANPEAVEGWTVSVETDNGLLTLS